MRKKIESEKKENYMYERIERKCRHEKTKENIDVICKQGYKNSLTGTTRKIIIAVRGFFLKLQ